MEEKEKGIWKSFDVKLRVIFLLGFFIGFAMGTWSILLYFKIL